MMFRKARLSTIVSLVMFSCCPEVHAEWWPGSSPANLRAFEAQTQRSDGNFNGWAMNAGPSNPTSDQGGQYSSANVAVPPHHQFTNQNRLAAQNFASDSVGQPNGYFGPQPAFNGNASSGGLMRMRITTDLLFLNRGAASDSLLVFDDTGPVASHSDLDFSGEVAVRLRAEFTTDFGVGFEFTYYDLDQFSSFRTDNGPGVMPVFFEGVPADPFSSYDTSYLSQLENYEAQIWLTGTPDARFGVGLRNFQLNEQFDTVRTGVVPESGFFSETTNDLWGAQLLLEARRSVSENTQVEARLAGGLYNNRISLDAITETIELHEKRDAFSTIFSFNAGFRYRVTRTLAVRAGYEGLLLGNVALAPEQSKALSLFRPENKPVTDHLYVGGAYLGSTVSF